MSILDDLAKVRELQGKEPLPDPTKIQGFGPEDPPVPPYLPPESATDPDLPPDWLDPDLDMPAPPPSPLVPKAPKPVPQPMPQLAERPPFSLMVMDRVAEWKGRVVQLLEPEEKSIRAVVLKAIQREVKADLLEAGVKRTRRKVSRSPVGAAEGSAGSTAQSEPGAAPAEPVKRRRGRPRGSLLRP